MRYWDIDDWVIFIIFIVAAAVGLPFLIVGIKETWAWMFSML